MDVSPVAGGIMQWRGEGCQPVGDENGKQKAAR
jgi:hypothetical protein